MPWVSLSREFRTMSLKTATASRISALHTSPDLKPSAVPDITVALNVLLADMFALYLKTKNFHWHMSGRHFRDYHLLLDEHAGQIFAMTDDIAERARKVGGTTLHSVSEISKYQRLKENNEESVGVREMLVELAPITGNFRR